MMLRQLPWGFEMVQSMWPSMCIVQTRKSDSAPLHGTGYLTHFIGFSDTPVQAGPALSRAGNH